MNILRNLWTLIRPAKETTPSIMISLEGSGWTCRWAGMSDMDAVETLATVAQAVLDRETQRQAETPARLH